MDNSQCFSPTDSPYGLSYGGWTVAWWRWALSATARQNPLLDDTGEHSFANQNGPVWFLAGTFGEGKCPKRKCAIPAGKAILFPVINFEASLAENPDFLESELVKCVKEDMDDIVIRDIMLDGTHVQAYRVASDPPLFSLNVLEQIKTGLPAGPTVASADGYWAFLKPLTVGYHRIYFHGECSGGTRNSSAEYEITTA